MTGATFVCEDCGNRVEDVPMRISRCVECGGDMKVDVDSVDQELDVAVEDVEIGDWIVTTEYGDGRPALVLDVDEENGRVWQINAKDTQRSGWDSPPSPSYVTADAIEAHVPRGELGDLGPAPIEVDVSLEDRELMDFPLEGKTVVLVGCGKAKREGEHVAKDLYTSTYFAKKRAYAEAVGDVWYILSAEYGLLSPNEVVESYDTNIEEVDAREWADDVCDELPPLAGAAVEVLAGPAYCEPLDLTLDMWADEVRYPTEGMKVGERMQWLAEHTPARGDVLEDEAAVKEEPVRPDLAAYLLDAVDRQGRDELAVLERYVGRRRRWLEHEDRRDLDEEELADDGEEIVDVENSGSGGATIVTKMVPCGKNCGGCPHGPYQYAVSRVDGDLKWDYQGKA